MLTDNTLLIKVKNCKKNKCNGKTKYKVLHI